MNIYYVSTNLLREKIAQGQKILL